MKEGNMKNIDKLIEIEGLLENLMKSNREGGILRIKVLYFCYLYQNLTVSMIIDKLGIKKTESLKISGRRLNSFGAKAITTSFITERSSIENKFQRSFRSLYKDLLSIRSPSAFS